jgi:ATP-dependent DNA helicase RecQ
VTWLRAAADKPRSVRSRRVGRAEPGATRVADLAQRLAGLGRLCLVPGALTAGNAGGFQAHTATNTEAATTALTRLSVTALVPPGPALAMDDTTRSGFTLTVAALLLREAGAGPVYPLALHKEI